MKQEPRKPQSGDSEARQKRFDPKLLRKSPAFIRPYRGLLAIIIGLTVLQDINSTLTPRITGVINPRQL